MIYLYVKKHRQTGLSYLGKTVQNPYEYKGSGKRWVSHIKKHGYDVETTILLATENSEEIKDTGLYFSQIFGIVKSKEWANIREETGDGGDTSKFINYETRDIGLKGKTYEELYGSEKAAMLKKSRGKHIAEQRKGKRWEEFFGAEKAAEMKLAKAEFMRKSRTGKALADDTKAKISLARKGVKARRACCLGCHRDISLNNFLKHLKTCVQSTEILLQ